MKWVLLGLAILACMFFGLAVLGFAVLSFDQDQILLALAVFLAGLDAVLALVYAVLRAV